MDIHMRVVFSPWTVTAVWDSMIVTALLPFNSGEHTYVFGGAGIHMITYHVRHNS